MASRKSKAPVAPADESLGFEEALGQLEQLVEEMENEQLPLERLVAHYEQGSKLLTHCQQVLESARERIELITLDNQRESGLENTGSPGDVGSTSSSAQEGPDPEDDDIRLF